LAADEGLEVIMDDGLCKGGEVDVTPRLEEDRVAAEALGLAGDARLGAAERAGELPMARACGET